MLGYQKSKWNLYTLTILIYLQSAHQVTIKYCTLLSDIKKHQTDTCTKKERTFSTAQLDWNWFANITISLTFFLLTFYSSRNRKTNIPLQKKRKGKQLQQRHKKKCSNWQNFQYHFFLQTHCMYLISNSWTSTL